MRGGQDWFGLPVTMGPALYLGAEDDEDELQRRVQAICDANMWRPAWFAHRGLHFASYVGRNMMLARIDGGHMMATELYWRLYHHAIEVRPVVIVLDPLSDIYPGDENNRAQVTDFMVLLRQLAVASGAAVIVNAHPSQAGSSNGSGTSGSTAWHGKLRARLYMRTDPKDPDARILEFKKNQYAKRGESIRLRFQGGIFVRDTDDQDGGTTNADETAERVFLALLDRYADENRNVTETPGVSFAPSRFANEPEAKAERVTNKALKAAMARLFKSKRIRIATEGPPSKQRSKIIRVVGG
ncbi:AAA family ATPase [Bradyrhizobium sp. Arg68]|nr:AAA family ATPase [Bradyrhizobium ivorense]